MKKTTEQASHYDNLEQKSIDDLLEIINREDKKVAEVVHDCIPVIIPLVNKIVNQLREDGRLIYIGSGTSGRLGIVDASECPPTFGVSHDLVIGLIAGGDAAIRKAREGAEDNPDGGWADLQSLKISDRDLVIGIAASGTTPYVVGALKHCREHGIPTGCITCNNGSPLAEHADFPVVAVVGPEVVTGSTRMKAGTAQKLILNMISTSVMIKLGRVKGNKMVDMQLTNQKLVERGIKMIQEELKVDYEVAQQFLETYGSVRAVFERK